MARPPSSYRPFGIRKAEIAGKVIAYGPSRFLLGSMASDVVRRGTASVLVIPPEPAPEAVQTPVREEVAYA